MIFFRNEQGSAYFNEVLYVTLKSFYLKKIYPNGIEKKTKNYLIHQENIFYKSITKNKEFSARNYLIKHQNLPSSQISNDKSVRYFKKILSIYILFLFWKKYTEIFQEHSQQLNSKNIPKNELLNKIFDKAEDLEIKKKNIPIDIPPKRYTDIFGERANSLFGSKLINQGNLKIHVLNII